MIKIGETRVVMAWRGTVNGDRLGIEYSEAPEATEAVKRLVEAAKFVVGANSLFDTLSAYRELKEAIVPFTDTEEGR